MEADSPSRNRESKITKSESGESQEAKCWEQIGTVGFVCLGADLFFIALGGIYKLGPV